MSVDLVRSNLWVLQHQLQQLLEDVNIALMEEIGSKDQESVIGKDIEIKIRVGIVRAIHKL